MTLDELFDGAPRVTHARLARWLRVRAAELKAEGDRAAIRFQATSSGRRVYTRAQVEAFLERADPPPPPKEKPGPKPLRRRRASVSGAVVDFQAAVAAQRARQP